MVLHVSALWLAPQSTVQAAISGGLVLLAPQFGTADIAVKHLVHPALTHLMLLVNPLTLIALLPMVVAF
ncbi:MAG: hypothetical protein ACYCXW_08655 [Solirubrobacteraceae bacterium]